MSKSQYSFSLNASHMVSVYGASNCAFITLTLAEDVCVQELGRRFKSFRTHFLGGHDWCRVYERQKSGRWHIHLLMAGVGDIRTGCQWQGNKLVRFSRRLRVLLRAVDKAARAAGFGRNETRPIRKARAAGAYLAKYLTKQSRGPLDKGVRLTAFSYGAPKVANTRFAWVSGRKYIQPFLAAVRPYEDAYEGDLSELFSAYIGPKWYYVNRLRINNTKTIDQFVQLCIATIIQGDKP